MNLKSNNAIVLASLLSAVLLTGLGPTWADPNSNPSTTETGSSTTTTQSSASSTSKEPETIDDKSDGWTWKGMEEYDDIDLYKGSGHAGGPGTYTDYTFSGTGVVVYGMSAPSITLDGASHVMGSVNVWIDGKQVGTNSVFSKLPRFRFIDFKIDGFPEGSHILHVEPAGGWAVIDYIKTLHSPPPPPEDESAKDLGPVYRIIPRNSQTKCLEINPSGTINGAGLDIWEVNPTRLQTWHVTPIGSNLFKITPVNYSDEAAWIVPPSPDGKTMTAFLWTFSGKPQQELILTQNSDGWYKIASADNDNIVMDVFAQGSGDGTPVIGYQSNNQYNQQWYLQAIHN